MSFISLHLYIQSLKILIDFPRWLNKDSDLIQKHFNYLFLIRFIINSISLKSTDFKTTSIN